MNERDQLANIIANADDPIRWQQAGPETRRKLTDRYLPSADALLAVGVRLEQPPTDPESIARAFHEAYERLAPAFGYRTREESAVPWDDVPTANKNVMLAVARDLLDSGVLSAGFVGVHPPPATELTRRDEPGTTAAWCRKHEDFAWQYDDGSFACFYLLVVESSDHNECDLVPASLHLRGGAAGTPTPPEETK